jgi:hypothetical protein
MNEFGETLHELMESRGLSGPADLARLLQAAGHPVPEQKIIAYMTGADWVDGRFPGWVAEVLDLSVWEMGILAYAVAYGQERQPP